MANLHAFRSTDPRGLQQSADPVGPGNYNAVYRMIAQSQMVICAWGAHPLHPDTARIRALLATHRASCLGTTKSGAPKHPLYLPASTLPVSYLQ